MCGEKNTERSSDFPMGIEPTTLRTLVKCSTYGLFTNLSEFRSILLPMFIQFLLSNLQINIFHGNESDACVIKSTTCMFLVMTNKRCIIMQSFRAVVGFEKRNSSIQQSAVVPLSFWLLFLLSVHQLYKTKSKQST